MLYAETEGIKGLSCLMNFDLVANIRLFKAFFSFVGPNYFLKLFVLKSITLRITKLEFVISIANI